eukprot:gb/GFBE01059601.1/.p1 GENE.gb/GFBE01059601.1/~~gb/GFBE01059601.1/.p1  ORF type:complete len:632 (+),score=149.44 gb/GFBE01059601.1/:1-1896(+)
MVQDQIVAIASPRPKAEKVDTGIVTSGKATRVVEIYNEDESECITIGASSSTRTPEIREIISSYTKIDADKIQLVSKVGVFATKQRLSDEVASKVVAIGVRSFKRPIKQYEHPIIVIGAGLGGMQTMIALKNSGRQDILCVEKLEDFGGFSWMAVANKFTKLQTERGTYHVDYMLPEAKVPTHIDGEVYKTWPSRDQLLKMFREGAANHDLGRYTRFNVHVEKVRPLPDGNGYSVHTFPANDPDGDGELLIASAVVAWPGNLCSLREIEWPGEDDFGGYIEYASFCKVDYREAEGKVCILYGHGAFTIENVRTLVEHKCKKVIVMCRKRNLCGMKVVSWMVGQSEVPVPGPIMLEGFQKMYDLVGFDVWSAHSVKTDANRTFAHVSQKTVFGVTDVYFLAGYYGLMEVVVDEIKRLTNGCANTKKGKKIKCQVILKAVGTVPDPQKDKMLGLKELVGSWVNGDPLRPVACNGMFVEARNFGSFSSGPGFVSMVRMFQWFIDYPSDFEIVRAALPRKKATADMPCYVPSATHMLPTMTTMGLIPMLQAHMNVCDALKHIKQKATHPMKQYLAECKAEWEAYIKAFKAEGMVDDRPEPPYPYTESMVQGWIDRTNMEWMRKMAAAQAKADRFN